MQGSVQRHGFLLSVNPAFPTDAKPPHLATPEIPVIPSLRAGARRATESHVLRVAVIVLVFGACTVGEARRAPSLPRNVVPAEALDDLDKQAATTDTRYEATPLEKTETDRVGVAAAVATEVGVMVLAAILRK
jgi:hypothetical protein